MKNNNTPKLRFKEFTDEWQAKTLGEIAQFRRGSFPQPYGLPKWYDDTNGAPFVQVFDVDDNMHLKKVTKRRISSLAEKQSVFADKGTLILTIQGSIGRIAITDYDAYVDRTLLIFSSYHQQIDKLFYMHSVYLLFEQEKKKAPGGTIKTITKERLTGFRVKLPSIAEQQKIADFLTAVDEKIEKLEAKKEQLAKYKKGVMQAIFSQKIRFRRPDGTSFPDWEEKKLGECLIIKHGKPQHEVETIDGSYPILATSGEIGRASKALCSKPSVLIGRKGTIDRPQYMDTPFWTVDTLFYSELRDRNIAKYFFYQFQLINWRLYNEGSGVPSLSASTISKIKLNVPSPEEQQKIAEFLTSLDKKVDLITKELEQAKLFKKALLQHMFV